MGVGGETHRHPSVPLRRTRHARPPPRRRRAARPRPGALARPAQVVERGTMARRGVLALFGGLGAAGLVACASDSSDTVDVSSPRAPWRWPGGAPRPAAVTASVEVADGEIPEETAGPYPGDGSNGVNVLTETGIVRSDITSSFGTASGVAEGVPLTIRLKVYDLNGEDATPLTGAAVYLWHCDRDGEYSLYSEAVAVGELPARRPGGGRRTGRWSSPASSPRRTTGAGRTSTSRSTKASTTRPARRTSCAPPSSRSPRTSATDGLRDRGLRGQRRQPRRDLARPATWSSPTATRSSWRPSPAASTRATWPRSTSPSDGGGRMGGCLPPCPPATPPRPTAHCPRRRSATSARGRSGGTSTCRSARSAAATATSTPTPPRSSARRRQPGRRTPRRRSPRSGWPGGCSATSTCRCRRCSSAAGHRPCCRPAT